jgi:hypothetical protein
MSERDDHNRDPLQACGPLVRDQDAKMPRLALGHQLLFIHRALRLV